MAIVWRGMTPDELFCWTQAMIDSGEVLALGDIGRPLVDKHSTGGVGDKTSLVLAPLAAACGIVVPMISGRGLGHSGGTLDKLESIPGFRVNLSLTEFRSLLARCGMGLIGQTPEIAPADRRLYALRDVTATVESLPLIAASIMSKKMAEGIDALVLDVKSGDGAFLGTLEQSRELARAMIAIFEQDARGPFNIAPPDTITMEETLHSAGKPVVRLPEWLLDPLADFLWKRRLNVLGAPASFLDFLRYPWVLDPGRLTHELGFEFRYSSREALVAMLRAKGVLR